MKPFAIPMTALGLLLLVNWCEAQSLGRIRPAHPALLGAVKQVRLPAKGMHSLTSQQ